MKKRTILTLIVITLTFGVIGCTSNLTELEKEVEEVQNFDRDNLDNFQSEERKFYVDGEVRLDKDVSGVYLKGNIVNDSGEKATYIAIEFDLFDDNNQKLGTARANVNNIEDGAVWEFLAKGEPFILDVTTDEALEETVEAEVAGTEVESEVVEVEALEEEIQEVETIDLQQITNFKITSIEGY